MLQINRMRLAAVLLLTASLVGCSSDKRASESTEAVETLRDVYTSLGKAKGQVDKVTALLDQFSTGHDLKSTLTDYTNAVTDLKSTAARAKERGEDMRKRREAYLAKWQAEANSIQDEQLKQGLQSRRATVASQYNAIQSAADDVRNSYQPFIRDCDEIQKALAIDLTPGGVQSAQPAITRAKRDGEVLGQKLDVLGQHLDQVIGTMTPSGQGAK